MLKWRTVTSSNHAKFMVKGTELSVALCGAHSRFQICEIRAYDELKNADRVYYVRDAATVTDAQTREGVRPEIVDHFAVLQDAIDFCEKNDPVIDFAVDNNV